MLISNVSIKRPVFASVLMLALVTLGIFSYRRLAIDMYPDVEIPVISVVTKFPGASPETVEREITKRIEEVVNKVQKEMDENLKTTGENAALEMGMTNIHPEIIKLLGRLKYRTSYGQNVLQHSKEVAALAGSLAAELGADITLAKRAGLLHDIGKAVDHEVEGTHAKIGADLAKRYNENQKVVDAIGTHHDDVQAPSVEAVLVAASDAISASRPGVRRETLEHYVKRLENLEKLADSFRGVEKSFAIQAGREVRIIVDSDTVDDVGANQLARDIAKKIEKELEYPGQVKVTVIREIRAVEVAK